MTCLIVHLCIGNECLPANFVSDSESTNKSVSPSNSVFLTKY